MIYRGTVHINWVGYICLEAHERGLCRIQIQSDPCPAEEKDQSNIHIVNAKHQLEQYFNGKLNAFDLKLDLSSGTTFQQSVWNEVYQIPFGQTTSYLNIAKSIGNEKAIRAVGAANGANPFPIVIPCHRVIASNGDLQGYAYGIEMKRKLLLHENPGTFGIQRSFEF